MEKLLALAETIKGLRRYLAAISGTIAAVAQLVGWGFDVDTVNAALGGILDAVSGVFGAVAAVLALWSKRSPDAPQA